MAWPAAAPDEPALSAGAPSSDGEALGRLLMQHQRAAYNVAFRVLGNEPDARDAVQEACLLAVRAARGEVAPLRERDRFRAWFLRVVSNAALQQLRRRPAAPNVSVEAIAEVLPAPGSVEPPRALERREERGDVLRALLSLPATQRAALTLREFQGLPYDEIAAALGVSRSTVQMLLFRARRSFRAAYEGLPAATAVDGCPELVPLLSTMLDDELALRPWLKLSAHLGACARCRRELRGLRRARKLHALLPLLAVPAGWHWAGVAEAAAMAGAGPTLHFARLGGLKMAATVVALGLGVAVVIEPELAQHPTGPEQPISVRDGVSRAGNLGGQVAPEAEAVSAQVSQALPPTVPDGFTASAGPAPGPVPSAEVHRSPDARAAAESVDVLGLAGGTESGEALGTRLGRADSSSIDQRPPGAGQPGASLPSDAAGPLAFSPLERLAEPLETNADQLEESAAALPGLAKDTVAEGEAAVWGATGPVPTPEGATQTVAGPAATAVGGLAATVDPTATADPAGALIGGSASPPDSRVPEPQVAGVIPTPQPAATATPRPSSVPNSLPVATPVPQPAKPSRPQATKAPELPKLPRL